ncbi:MAG: integration host factor subunit beta [Deltaproteobacteria bacterium]|jgi:integration host factor subunit beta|nr:integration host factor subunit beta [Deltaproteobacteria bacterium]
MTKSELVEKVARKVKNFSKKDIEVICDIIFNSMTETLKAGDKVEIRGFGSFKVKERKPRQGRNPKTGDTIDIPFKKVPFFKAGKELRERVDSDRDI